MAFEADWLRLDHDEPHHHRESQVSGQQSEWRSCSGRMVSPLDFISKC